MGFMNWFRKGFDTKYTVGKKCGVGSTAVVKECTEKKTGKVFAVKIIDKRGVSERSQQLFKREIEIMKSVEHPGFVTLHDCYDDEKKILVVVDLCGDELFDRIIDAQHFTEATAARLMTRLLESIQYLHSKGIVHRDLKPENILYPRDSEAGSEAEAKICDFGLAGIMDPFDASSANTMTTACGTPNYVAPEVIRRAPYGPAVDVWSLGVILYILLHGYPPFPDDNNAMLFKAICAGEFSFDDEIEIQDSAKDLISRMMTVDPNKRITVEQALEHPWLIESRDSSTSLQGAQERMRAYNAKRRLRKAMLGVWAGIRMERVAKALAGTSKPKPLP